MLKTKVYKCCICHRVLDYKPIRLVKQLYGIGNYNQYSYDSKYDFCNKCYKAFDNFINKYKEE